MVGSKFSYTSPSPSSPGTKVSPTPCDRCIFAKRAGTSRSSAASFRIKKCRLATRAHSCGSVAETPSPSKTPPASSFGTPIPFQTAPGIVIIIRSGPSPQGALSSKSPHHARGPFARQEALSASNARRAPSTTSFLYRVSVGRLGAKHSGDPRLDATCSAYS